MTSRAADTVQAAMTRAFERRREILTEQAQYRAEAVENVAKTICRHRKGSICKCGPICFATTVYRKDAELIVAGLQTAGFIPKLPAAEPGWENDLRAAIARIRRLFEKGAAA